MKKIIIIILFIISLCCIVFYYFYNIDSTIVLKKNLDVLVNSDINNLDFIKKVNNGEVITKKKKIDTSKLGSYDINIKLMNKFRKKTSTSFSINIIDNIAPEISYKDTIEITQYDKVDLLRNVKATDNYDNDIEVKVVGNYDTNKDGVYSLYYVAVDSSNNEVKKEFTLKVKKKVNSKPSVPSSTPSSTFTTSKGFNGKVVNGVTYIDGVLIANKTYSLPSNYGNGLTSETQNSFNKMKESAKAFGLNISIISGFRSFDRQKTIYNNYVSRDGKSSADRYSARPGNSEHQTGLAIDVNSLSTTFENTNEGKWLKDNCYKFGFILRYTKDGESKTGYMYEPWHFRYVGEELATKLYNGGNWITIEEYFGITSYYN